MFNKVFHNSLMLNILLLIVFLNSVIAVTPSNETTLKLYYGPDFKDSVVYKLTDAANILDDSNFKAGDTHIYMHGWQETQDSDDIHTIVDAYSKRDNINLIAVDWAKAASENYMMSAFANIELLAPALSDAITDMYNAGMDPKSLTVVGHGLGAQLAGLTGRNIIEKSNGTDIITNMAVLDPALLFFGSIPPGMLTVNRNDAGFLQAIHTDIGIFGQPEPLGHVDFWPNGGQLQPGCSVGPMFPFSQGSQFPMVSGLQFPFGQGLPSVLYQGMVPLFGGIPPPPFGAGPQSLFSQPLQPPMGLGPQLPFGVGLSPPMGLEPGGGGPTPSFGLGPRSPFDQSMQPQIGPGLQYPFGPGLLAPMSLGPVPPIQPFGGGPTPPFGLGPQPPIDQSLQPPEEPGLQLPLGPGLLPPESSGPVPPFGGGPTPPFSLGPEPPFDQSLQPPMGPAVQLPLNPDLPAPTGSVPVLPFGGGPTTPFGQGPLMPFGQGLQPPMFQGMVPPFSQGPPPPFGLPMQPPIGPGLQLALGQGQLPPLSQGMISPMYLGMLSSMFNQGPLSAKPQDLCSHKRSWMFWAESVARTNETYPKFLGFPFLSYEMFMLEVEENKSNNTVEMGIDCPKSANGTYYLTTNSESLFARGIEGYHYGLIASMK